MPQSDPLWMQPSFPKPLRFHLIPPGSRKCNRGHIAALFTFVLCQSKFPEVSVCCCAPVSFSHRR